MIYLDLFLGFLRVGMFAFGGAYGAIPMIRDVVLSYGWLTDEELTYMIAVSESTPGPIMLNLATFVGQSQAGVWGAVLATLAVVLPSFLIILLVTASLKTLIKKPWLQAILKGVKPCVTGIVLATGIFMILSNCILSAGQFHFNTQAFIITLILFAVMIGYKLIFHKKLSPILLILISGLLGILI